MGSTLWLEGGCVGVGLLQAVKLRPAAKMRAAAVRPACRRRCEGFTAMTSAIPSPTGW